jgi:hypothetical protein
MATSSRRNNAMSTRLDYRASIYNALGQKIGTGALSYTPTLADAIDWSRAEEQSTFVLGLLHLGLVGDGDDYCIAQVEAVEGDYITLLDDDDNRIRRMTDCQ